MTRRWRMALLGAMLWPAPPWVAAEDPLAAGKQIYDRYCMGCHGVNGEGMMPGMPNFALGERLDTTDRDLAERIRQGNGVMPGFAGTLSDREIDDVIAYIRSLL